MLEPQHDTPVDALEKAEAAVKEASVDTAAVQLAFAAMEVAKMAQQSAPAAALTPSMSKPSPPISPDCKKSASASDSILTRSAEKCGPV